jgi:hypothetical protein
VEPLPKPFHLARPVEAYAVCANPATSG